MTLVNLLPDYKASNDEPFDRMVDDDDPHRISLVWPRFHRYLGGAHAVISLSRKQGGFMVLSVRGRFTHWEVNARKVFSDELRFPN